MNLFLSNIFPLMRVLLQEGRGGLVTEVGLQEVNSSYSPRNLLYRVLPDPTSAWQHLVLGELTLTSTRPLLWIPFGKQHLTNTTTLFSDIGF